jgi:hypothetical protein
LPRRGVWARAQSALILMPVSSSVPGVARRRLPRVVRLQVSAMKGCAECCRREEPMSGWHRTTGRVGVRLVVGGSVWVGVAVRHRDRRVRRRRCRAVLGVEAAGSLFPVGQVGAPGVGKIAATTRSVSPITGLRDRRRDGSGTGTPRRRRNSRTTRIRMPRITAGRLPLGLASPAATCFSVGPVRRSVRR